MAAFVLPPHAPPISAVEIQADLRFAEIQVTKTVARLTGSGHFPRAGADRGLWTTVAASDWVSGFFPGELWLLYQATGDNNWRLTAHSWTAGLAGQAARTDTHDVGFIIGTSFGNGYRLTHDPTYLPVIQQAATSLATRYNAAVGAIRSWSWGPWRYPVIIDNMMTLTPLLWGAKHGGSAAWANMAVQHANTTLAALVRADGSTVHLADVDPSTGAVVGQRSYQGYADTSTWARGEAWAIYGFAAMYAATKAPQFLQVAELAANFFLSHLPSDLVPFWDFNAPVTPTTPRDTSAAAVAASALIELSTLVNAPDDQRTYLADALAILGALSSPSYLGPSQGEAILQHGTGGSGFEMDTSLIYGDYFFLEALLRAQTVLRGQALWSGYDSPTTSPSPEGR